MSTNTIQMYVNIKKNNVSTSTGFGKYYLNADTNETLSSSNSGSGSQSQGGSSNTGGSTNTGGGNSGGSAGFETGGE